tara:strand:+ start:292 stop:633 length:342 start_codon:yes stop_codon:yes gene_type:complete
MAISYEWNCKTCDIHPEYEDEDDVVYAVHWRLKATSSETNGEGVPYTTEMYGTIGLTIGDLSGFISFANLTNEDTTGWVEDTMGEDQVQELKDNLDSNIAGQIAPISETKTIA